MLSYLHVDVFAPHAYAGNSLPVFLDSAGLNTGQMQAITRELRHFEAIFLEAGADARTYRARVFDLVEELPFAGHPIIGAAAALHETAESEEDQHWTFDLADKSVSVTTQRTGSGYFGLLDQGPARFLGEVATSDEIAAAFGLTFADLDPTVPLAVISTGLRYLIVPVGPQVLARARIKADITGLLAGLGAQFAVLFDRAACEIRHWNNDGILEDIATGSAAGTIGAYCLRHCGAQSGKVFTLNQGRFAGRPSELSVEPHGTPDNVTSVKVGGEVAIVGRGAIVAPSHA
ncbi:MAG TPA: PhzF family phenazine biosynthesis protein [Mesorhizobium sp.]|jgi:PhzF family phenazine biosynthesis protein|uniref:PhzF family phenazine biosynthesis protein n=1 Tax=Mesorhizobium sp. TaxID=1871066 RepID=UPI002DDCAD6D|nr:PhzF family phenazine biosynthesis protein [Mesorhizobium sp.]HEV2506622.1 PhzF family phenazine biosynthesis protein [Mesorhizobium sp.]